MNGESSLAAFSGNFNVFNVDGFYDRDSRGTFTGGLRSGL